MTGFRPIGRLLVGVAAALILTACSGKQNATEWTLWYIPNEPRPGVVARTANPCHTYVFASSPGQTSYAVAVIKGWSGSSKPVGNSATMHTGEEFSGPLTLGTTSVHDDSNGYDVNLDVVYNVDTYVPAKARADADCRPLPPVRPSPKGPQVSPKPSRT